MSLCSRDNSRNGIVRSACSARAIFDFALRERHIPGMGCVGGVDSPSEERPMTTLDSAGTEQDLWHVEVGPDDVRVVTLDQLDEAFQDGLVTESMRVWQEGMPCAVSLGELLGGGDEEEAPEQSPEV